MPTAGGIRAGRAYVELFTKDAAMVRGLKKARAKLNRFGTSVGAIGAKMLGAAALAAVPIAFATKTYADFGDQMAVVKAVSRATADQFKNLSDQAKLLGRTTSFMASEVAGAQIELARAGFNPDQIMAATPAVLDLARATGTELPEAAAIAAATMRGFGMSADQTTEIADTLTAAANQSAQTLTDMGEAMKMVAPIAAEAGANLNDTAAAVGVLANNGIKGTMAGTALARAYKNLSASKTQGTLKSIGVDAMDAAGNLRPLSTIISEVGKATAGMGSGQRLSIFEQLFGRGQAAALKLSGGDAFGDLQQAMNNSAGAAKTTAKAMDDTLGGSFRMLMSAAEGVQIALGEAIGPVIRGWAEGLQRVAGVVSQFITENKALVVAGLKVIAIVGAVGAGLVVAGAAIVGVGAVVGSLAAIVGAAYAAFGMFIAVIQALFTPLGLVTAALAGLAAYLLYTTGAGSKALDWLAEKFEHVKERAGKAIGGIRDALAAGNLKLAAKVAWAAVQVEFQRGLNAIVGTWQSLKTRVLTIVGEIKFGAMILLTEGWASVQTAWVNVTSAMSDAWHNFTGALVTGWKWAQNSISKGIARLMANFSDELDGDEMVATLDKEFRQAERARRGERSRDEAKREQQTAYKLEEIETRRKQFTEVYAGSMQQEEADRRDRNAATMTKRQKALADAEREYQAALDSSAKARVDIAAGKTTEFTYGSTAGLAAVANPAAVQANAGGTTAGTFSSFGLRGLGGSTAAERTAKAAEKTAENTEKIAHGMHTGAVIT